MNSRTVRVFPGLQVGSVSDTSAVLVSTGVMSLGLTVAEARELAQRIARAADDVEYNLSLRTRLRNEHRDQPKVQSYEQYMESQCAYHADRR
jgi:hypothetical protein